jgi:hypothetical protein
MPACGNRAATASLPGQSAVRSLAVQLDAEASQPLADRLTHKDSVFADPAAEYDTGPA